MMIKPKSKTMDSRPKLPIPSHPHPIIPLPGIRVSSLVSVLPSAPLTQRASSIIRMVSRSTSSATVLRAAAPGKSAMNHPGDSGSTQ